MSDEMMKQVMNALQTMNTKLTSMEEELKSLKKQDEKPEKVEKAKMLSFGDTFGHLFVNAEGTPIRIKHSAEEKNGEDDDWYAVWDARAQNFAREGSDEVYVTPTAFGQAHNEFLLAAGTLKRKTTSCNGWDDVKYLNTLKNKWITLDTLRPEELKKVRSKSALRKSTDGKSSEGLSISTKGRRKSGVTHAASPKVMEAATSAAMSAVVPAVANAAINAHAKEFKNFPFWNEKRNKVVMVNSADDVDEDLLGSLNVKEYNFVAKNKQALFSAFCDFYSQNDNSPLTENDVDNVFKQQMDG
jgi:hypothetical protein